MTTVMWCKHDGDVMQAPYFLLSNVRFKPKKPREGHEVKISSAFEDSPKIKIFKNFNHPSATCWYSISILPQLHGTALRTYHGLLVAVLMLIF